jgi:SNF2 family DNA or RNA helicase
MILFFYIKYIDKNKIEFLEYFIQTKMYSNCKIIFCSKYIRIFNDIKILFEKYHIKYLELDDGNIESINESVKKYTYGNINALLLNSNLFGCGLNLQCTTDIVFLHRTEETLEKQIIGRAQRLGRLNKLNIWYLMHENERTY